MTAYFVAVRKEVTDPEAMARYRELAAVAREGHALTPLAAYGKVKALEGAAVDGAVILAFPTFEEAENWYFSAAYQEAFAHRLKGAQYQTFILQGLDQS